MSLVGYACNGTFDVSRSGKENVAAYVVRVCCIPRTDDSGGSVRLRVNGARYLSALVVAAAEAVDATAEM